jgi:hypothetical protein
MAKGQPRAIDRLRGEKFISYNTIPRETLFRGDLFDQWAFFVPGILAASLFTFQLFFGGCLVCFDPVSYNFSDQLRRKRLIVRELHGAL